MVRDGDVLDGVAVVWCEVVGADYVVYALADAEVLEGVARAEAGGLVAVGEGGAADILNTASVER